MKSPVVLRALDNISLHQPAREVNVPVSTGAVGGIDFARFVAVNREGFLSMVEAKNISTAKIFRFAYRDPAFGVGHSRGDVRLFPLLRLGCRKLAFDVISGVSDLLEDGWNDLAPGRK